MSVADSRESQKSISAEDPLTQISDHRITWAAWPSPAGWRRRQGFLERLTRPRSGRRSLVVVARRLAWLYGCRVHGLDLSAQRVREARELTALVGLESLVTFDCADAMTIPLSRAAVRRAVGSRRTWGRISSVSATSCRSGDADALGTGPAGRRRRVRASSTRRTAPTGISLAALEDHLEELFAAPRRRRRVERACSKDRNLAIALVDDCSADLLGHFLQSKEGATRPEAAAVSQFEQDAWRLAASNLRKQVSSAIFDSWPANPPS